MAASEQDADTECSDSCCGVLKQHLDLRRRTKKHRFLILYGSETGNSKSIAERILDQALSRGLPAKMATLDEYETLDFLGEEPTFCSIVVSTTGNGDAPKGAEKFFRFVKKRTHKPDTVKAVSYTVLALGDSNYDKFCFVGQTVDARMSAIGGKQLQSVTCVDEVLGMEAQVEPWINRIWDMYHALDAHQHTPLRLPSSSTLIGEEPSLAQPGIVAHTNDDKKGSSPAGFPPKPLSTSRGIGYSLPKSFLSFDNLPHESCKTIEAAAAATKRLPRVREPFVSSKFSPTKTAFRLAKLIKGEYLTKPFEGEDDERVVMKVSLEFEPDVSWDVGDSVAIRCKNPPVLVDGVVARLGLDPNEVVSSQDGTKWTIRGVLECGVDLHTSPDKGFLRTLAMFCQNELDRARMDLLSSFGGKKEYDEIIETQKLNVLEVLSLFPSCKPSLDQFLGALGPEPSPPRYYSIASSPLDSPNIVEICFSVVKHKISKERTVCGVCTNLLEAMACDVLQGNAPSTLEILVKPNPAFKLPADESRPIIMVGPGTGVAPFMGFIRHRPATVKSRLSEIKASAPVCGLWRGGLDLEDELEHADDALIVPFKCRTPDAPIGSSTLYFGCRRPEQDFLFKEELQELEKSGSLSVLRVAFSRVDPKKYVQDLMIDDGKGIADKLLCQNAYFYVCGDGTKMARDVQAAVIEILVQHGNLDSDQAKAYVVEMQKRARYVQDIW